MCHNNCHNQNMELTEGMAHIPHEGTNNVNLVLKLRIDNDPEYDPDTAASKNQYGPYIYYNDTSNVAVDDRNYYNYMLNLKPYIVNGRHIGYYGIIERGSLHDKIDETRFDNKKINDDILYGRFNFKGNQKRGKADVDNIPLFFTRNNPLRIEFVKTCKKKSNMIPTNRREYVLFTEGTINELTDTQSGGRMTTAQENIAKAMHQDVRQSTGQIGAFFEPSPFIDDVTQPKKVTHDFFTFIVERRPLSTYFLYPDKLMTLGSENSDLANIGIFKPYELGNSVYGRTKKQLETGVAGLDTYINAIQSKNFEIKKSEITDIGPYYSYTYRIDEVGASNKYSEFTFFSEDLKRSTAADRYTTPRFRHELYRYMIQNYTDMFYNNKNFPQAIYDPTKFFVYKMIAEENSYDFQYKFWITDEAKDAIEAHIDQIYNLIDATAKQNAENAYSLLSSSFSATKIGYFSAGHPIEAGDSGNYTFSSSVKKFATASSKHIWSLPHWIQKYVPDLASHATQICTTSDGNIHLNRMRLPKCLRYAYEPGSDGTVSNDYQPVEEFGNSPTMDAIKELERLSSYINSYNFQNDYDDQPISIIIIPTAGVKYNDQYQYLHSNGGIMTEATKQLYAQPLLSDDLCKFNLSNIALNLQFRIKSDYNAKIGAGDTSVVSSLVQ